jgi:chromosome segregation ATPase
MKELIARLRNDCYQEDEVRAHAKEAADALERLTIENTQLQKDYTRIKESATLWHDRYKTKCQEYIDRQAILGAGIIALETERDSLQEGLDGWHSRFLDMAVERDVEKEHVRQCVANIANLRALLTSQSSAYDSGYQAGREARPVHGLGDWKILR